MKYSVLLYAGLGNQMFGYAFAKYLEKKTKTKVTLSLLNYIVKHDHNGMELLRVFRNIRGVSNNTYKIVDKLYRFLFFHSVRKWVYRIFRNILYPDSICLFTNEHYRYFDYPIVGKYFYSGFWQNYSYISFVKDEILHDFVFRLPEQGAYKTYEKKIKDSPVSVAIHIRRGDYLLPQYSDYNIFEDVSFFQKAIEYLEQSFGCCTYYIFSDDIAYCKEEFQDDNFFFVDVNHGKDSYLDMYLMSICDHNIISNSTFSWWAAFLNRNKEKVVIAPCEWTKHSRIKTSSFSPQEWLYM